MMKYDWEHVHPDDYFDNDDDKEIKNEIFLHVLCDILSGEFS